MTAHLDGNAIAGALSEIFLADMTTARSRCRTCGDIAPIAMAMVFVKPRTYVVRCHACEDVLFTVQLRSSGSRLDLDALASLDFEPAT
jgi:phage tail tube protein FII